MVSAFFRNTGGSNLPKTHTITPATIAKLIHLKISVACSVAALPPSSAACAPATAKSNTNSMAAAKQNGRFPVIEPLSRERRHAPVFRPCAAQFQRKVAQQSPHRRARQQQ